MIRANSFSNKPRTAFKLDGFMGADYSSSVLEVTKNRAVSMRNFINENGINKKRNGWEQLLKFDGRINGFWYFSTLEEESKSRKECAVIHEGKNIWSVDLIVNGSTVFGDKTLLSGGIGSITDERSYAVQNSGRLFILCGDYLVFRHDGDNWILEPVLGSGITFIPTTMINRGIEGASDDIIATKDKPSYLSKRRINSFEGYAGSETSVSYLLDTDRIDLGKIILTITSFDEETNRISYTSYEAEYTTESQNVAGFFVPGTSTGIGANIEPKTGRINFTDVSLIQPMTGLRTKEDVFTLEFTYLARDDESALIDDYYTRIQKCSIGAMFGLGGVNDRLFLAGNPDYPNICFHSELKDFTYFPDDNTAVCGSDASVITAFSRLGDGTLAIHKNTSGNDANIYFRTGEINASSTTEVFPIRAGSIGEGVISGHACDNLSGDNLILSENGVYGIVLSSNVATDERYARERSRLINSVLTKHSLKDAASIVFKNRYYLSVDNECFIADARFSSTKEGDMPDSYNYEWWHWDNIPARVWCVLNGGLYFGSHDGRICKFGEGYADISKEELESEDFTLNISENNFYINKNLIYGLRGSDRFTITTENGLYTEYINGLTINEENRLVVMDESNVLLLNGQVVYVYGSSGSGLIEGKEYRIGDIAYGERSFALYDGDNGVIPLNPDFKLCVKIDGLSLQVINANPVSFTFQIAYAGGEEPLKMLLPFSDTEGGKAATLIYRHNVVAEWISPIFDLGDNLVSKTLKSISISTEPSVNGKIEFGYKTRHLEQLHERVIPVKGARTFDFSDVDFSDFSFEVNSFATNYTKPLKVKNFNYIMLKFKSDNDRECAVNSVSVEYTMLKHNKGLR